jgi:hypothetical protein
MTMKIGQRVVEILDRIMNRLIISKRAHGITVVKNLMERMRNTMDSSLDVWMQTIQRKLLLHSQLLA